MSDPTSEAARILGERMRDARQKQGASQEDIAQLAEMHVSNYGKIERGLGNPNFLTLVRLAAVLGIDPSKLVRGITGAMAPDKPEVYTAADFVRERRARAKG